MNVSIVIPNYNGVRLLEKNLPKVIEAAKYFEEKNKSIVEIIVVDDSSKDESVAFIKTQKLRFVENEQNLGFSSTVNRGVKIARGDVVVLLNTDVKPERDFLLPLVENFKMDENVFAVGCMDKSVEADKSVLRGRGIGKWNKGFLAHARGEVDKYNTLWVSGGSGAFRKSIWDRLGGLNELYNPFYWEDIDIAYRALKSGYKLVFEPKSVVVHEHEKGAIKSHYTKYDIKKIAYRNQFIFVWLNATDLSLQFMHFLWLPYHFIKAIYNKDLAFFTGFIQAVLRLPRILKTSFQSQRLFVHSDREVIQEFLY